MGLTREMSMSTLGAVVITAAGLTAGGVTTADAAPKKPRNLVKCYDGTPGPALYADGKVRYSQWCFDTRGGREYLEQERQSGRH